MQIRVLVPGHRPAAPPPAAVPALAGPAPGFLLSLAAHAALAVGVLGGGGTDPQADPAAPAAGEPRETLLWVGVEATAGAPGAAPRRGWDPEALPPLAYVVPGGRGAARAGRGDGAAGERAGVGRERRAPGAPAPAPRALPVPARATALRDARPLVELPRVGLPDAEVARLVAGVVASGPDRARRVSRPEDFVPMPTPGAALTQAGALAAAELRAAVGPLPIPLATNPAPEYPLALARAGVGGRVVVEFRIDSTGAVDEGSLRVVESGGPAFADAVRRVLPRLRFVPGVLGERPVAVTVRQPFLFVMRRGA